MDPMPIKHSAVLLAHIRDEIEPSLGAAGFRFDARNHPPDNHCASLWIDYLRQSDVFSLRWERSITRLAAERLDEQGNVEVLADVRLKTPRSHDELMSQIAPFIESIKNALARPTPDSGEQPPK